MTSLYFRKNYIRGWRDLEAQLSARMRARDLEFDAYEGDVFHAVYRKLFDETPRTTTADI